MRIRAILLMAALPVFAQEIKMPASVERLSSKAVETVDVMLDGALLQLAGRFLSGHKPDEAKVKNMLGGLKGIYVRSFEFSQEGEYTAEDVEAIRSQLRVPGWSKIVGVVSKKDKEHTEIFIKTEGSSIGGLVILAAEPKELTLVHINGSIDLEKLSELGGHFGVPKIDVETKPHKD
jgi:Domain of unknown function (DUF4252)